jgi:hypothetical protein
VAPQSIFGQNRRHPLAVQLDEVAVARKKRWYLPYLLAAIAAVVLALLARNGALHLPGSAPATATATAAPTAPAATAAASQLDRLKVAAALPMTGYSRAKFPHWIDQGGGCDTREVVLKRDGTGVTTGANCQPTAGKWHSAYDNTWLTQSSRVQIDHVVPLANAWRSGAANWTTDKRQQFANDLTDPQLLAVSSTTNESKGDQDPSTWKPPNTAEWCDYASRWIAVKTKWQLTITAAEKTALRDMLTHCR